MASAGCYWSCNGERDRREGKWEPPTAETFAQYGAIAFDEARSRYEMGYKCGGSAWSRETPGEAVKRQVCRIIEIISEPKLNRDLLRVEFEIGIDAVALWGSEEPPMGVKRGQRRAIFQELARGCRA